MQSDEAECTPLLTDLPAKDDGVKADAEAATVARVSRLNFMVNAC
jgi:hypothetical protein